MMRLGFAAAIAVSVFSAASHTFAAETDICSSARLMAADRAACSDRMRAAVTDQERDRVVAEFSQRLKPGGTPDSGAIGTRPSVGADGNIDARPKATTSRGSSTSVLRDDPSALRGLPLPGSSGQPLLRPNPGVGATGGVRTTGGGALPQ